MRNRFVLSTVASLILGLAAESLFAQADPEPHQDPTGQTGVLKANVQTGCGYNAHSGNASRSVTDLAVPGALGEYGLNFIRNWNSVPPAHDLINAPAIMPRGDFGQSGWSHSWAWTAEVQHDLPSLVIGGGGPNETDHIYETSIAITFPDGRVIKYTVKRFDEWASNGSLGRRWCGPPYDPAYGEEDWPFAAGVYDRLEDMAPDGSSFWLHLADGGSVFFEGYGFVMDAGFQLWSYRAREVYDPHGLKTRLEYNPDAAWQLTDVIQEGGRWLKIIWGYLVDGSIGPGDQARGKRTLRGFPGCSGGQLHLHHDRERSHPAHGGIPGQP